MKGNLLNFNVADSEGLISGDDGKRYHFKATEWKDEALPTKDMYLDFIVDEAGEACEIFTISIPKDIVPDYIPVIPENWYKSSDNGIFAGVCAGIAHKQKISLTGIRIATVICSLFFVLPFFIYILLWILFPAKNTRTS